MLDSANELDESAHSCFGTFKTPSLVRNKKLKTKT